jgi:M6 family metalloprotease-like protein
MRAPELLRASLPTLLLIFLAAPPVGAQIPARDHHPHERHFAPDGRPLDFSADGVWRVRARDVRQTRERLRTQRRFDQLNAPALMGGTIQAAGAPQGSWSGLYATAVTGVLRPPTILVAFADTPLDSVFPAAEYDRLLYGTTAYNAQRPYTLRTFYEEMSGGLFSVQGEILGWVVAPEPMAYYTEACWDTSQQNAMFCWDGLHAFGELMVDALRQLEDQGVDFSAFDGTGDGHIDLLQFVQPVLGGECGGPGMWAHRWNLTWPNRSEPVMLMDGAVQASNYTIQSGLGGIQCNAEEIMAIGTIGHELGHGLGLPDLYDTGGTTSGAGTWDLMGSGGWASTFSPSQMGAWSKEDLGWVTVREITESEVVDLGPVLTEREVLLVRPTGANPRGEYFLLENRQALGSDLHMVGTGPKPGMLVWHVDSLRVAQARASNQVNVGAPPAIHGVALVQADGLNQLRTLGTMENPRNLGDAGDPFPGRIRVDNPDGSIGWRSQHELTDETLPAWVLNHDGSAVGYGLYNIQESGRESGIPNRVTFDLRRDGDLEPLFARADHPEVQVVVDGGRHDLWMGRLRAGETVDLSVDSLTVVGEGQDRARAFRSWSHGGARVQTLAGPMERDTLVATTSELFRVLPVVEGQGTLQGLPDSTSVGLFREPHDTLTVVAVPAAGYFFRGFAGDAERMVIRGDTAVLDMSSPFLIRATFQPVPTITLIAIIDHLVSPLLQMPEDHVYYLDFYGNRNGVLDLGDALAWVDRAEDPAEAAAAAARLFQALREQGGEVPSSPERSRTTNPEIRP